MSATRADRVDERLRELELDALVVTDLVDVRWLTGFTGTAGIVLVAPDARLLLTDFRYVEQASAQVGDGFEVLRAGRDLLGEFAPLLPAGRIGFDEEQVTVKAHDRLVGKAPAGAELAPVAGLVGALREVKDERELERIAAAAALADAVFEKVVTGGGPLAGRTERALAVELEHELRLAGAEGPSFPPIVAAGAHGALPHAEPRDVAIPAGVLVTVDWGARLDGYCSDCTRTLASGPVDGRAREIYELVLAAQEAALAAVAPGAGCATVDGIARSKIAAGGHAKRFGHGLGHGVGLEVHEGPRLAKAAAGKLAAGNVVTIEPGVYLPGELGVRIEDMAVVADDGPRILTGLTKALTEA